MRQVTANEVKQGLGRILEAVQRESVVIQRYNRDTAVMLSMEEYEKLTAAHIDAFEAFCDRVGQQAEARGLTGKKLEQILK